MKVKTLTLTVALVALALGIQSCKSTKPSITVAQLEGQWTLKSINGQNASSAFTNIPTIEFNEEEKHVSGTSGCNRFFGQFSLNKNVLETPQLGSTMMMCMDANQEPEFHKLLSKPSNLSLTKDVLTFNQDGKAVLVFTKAKPLGATELSGKWTLHMIEGATANTQFGERTPSLTLDFTENRLNGNAGCNQYNATFKLADNKIDVSQPAATRMACEHLAGEGKFLQLLTGTSKVSIENGMLTFSRNGLMLLQFTK